MSVAPATMSTTWLPLELIVAHVLPHATPETYGALALTCTALYEAPYYIDRRLKPRSPRRTEKGHCVHGTSKHKHGKWVTTVKRTGVWTTTYETNAVTDAGGIVLSHVSRKHGAHTFVDDGVTVLAGTYLRDNMHGTWREFTHVGIPMNVTTYWYGVRDGVCTEMWPCGRPKTETHYSNDKKHGPETDYYRNGKKSSHGTHVDGRLVALDAWYADGGKSSEYRVMQDPLRHVTTSFGGNDTPHTRSTVFIGTGLTTLEIYNLHTQTWT